MGCRSSSWGSSAWASGRWRLVSQDRQPIGRLLRAGRRGPVRRPHQGPEIPPPRPGRRIPRRTGHRPRDDAPLRGRSTSRSRTAGQGRGRVAKPAFPVRESRARLPEERSPALSGLPRRLAVAPERHQSVGPTAGEPGPEQPERSHLRPPVAGEPDARPARPSRSGGLFGGPYLWFNYITRMLVQETALLILDYNRNAIPARPAGVLARSGAAKVPSLAGGPAQDRSREVWLPDPCKRGARTSGPAGSGAAGRPGDRRDRDAPAYNPPPRRRARSSRRSSSRPSTSWPTTSNARPRSGPGSARRSPSWSVTTASRTSVALPELPAPRAAAWPRGRSTRRPVREPTWPGAGSSCCRSDLARAGAGWGPSGASSGSSRDPPPPGRPAHHAVRHLLGRLAQDPPNAQACVHGVALAACPLRRRVPGAAAADRAAGIAADS